MLAEPKLNVGVLPSGLDVLDAPKQNESGGVGVASDDELKLNVAPMRGPLLFDGEPNMLPLKVFFSSFALMSTFSATSVLLI